MSQTSRRISMCCALFGALGFFMMATEAPSAHRPRYTAAGLLELPQDFHTWVFVGANLSPEYKSGGAELDKLKARTEAEKKADKKDDAFHNIYINPESYEAFKRTGTFPDPTMLVMEVFRAEDKDAGGVLSRGQFEGKRISLSAAVKDKNRPDGGVPWAYYTFEQDKQSGSFKPAEAFPDAMCYDCHLKHASKDNVWVQFYPALRDPG
jgi:hypothetical protein